MLTSASDLYNYTRHSCRFLLEELNEYKINLYDLTSINTYDFISLVHIAQKLPDAIGVRNPQVRFVDLNHQIVEHKASAIMSVYVCELLEVMKLVQLSIEHFGTTRIDKFIKEAHGINQEMTIKAYSTEAYVTRTGLDHIQNPRVQCPTNSLAVCPLSTGST